MYEQENSKILHIVTLLVYTIFSVALIGWSVFAEGETAAAVLLILGLAASWTMHFTEILPARARLWIYTILLMVSFYYYGIHDGNIYDLAPIMGLFILVYTATEESSFIRVCALTYYFTIGYDFVFASVDSPVRSLAVPRIVLHFVLIFLTERLAELTMGKHKKEKLHTEKKISQLEEANQSAEDFLTNASHELLTPINAVTGITTVMLKKEEEPEKKENLLSIQMAGNRLLNQIEDILDYSEIDTGRISVREEAYRITSLIQDIVVDYQVMNSKPNVELMFDIDAGIPSILLGDERKIKKILRHLIDNALKFTRKGGVHARVYALPKAYGINLCIRISDTGIGMSEEELGKIRKQFFQSNAGRNRKNGGLGLGLSIVCGIVSAMEGFIQFESEEGKGTVVSVSIPQQVEDASPCLEVANMADLSIVCYLRPEKYEVPEVRDYYNETISHIVQELDVTLHRVFEFDECKRLVSLAKLTHMIVGMLEYEENASYFEKMDKSVQVIVVADEDFQPDKNSRVKVIRKPFYIQPIVNILNSKEFSEEKAAEKEFLTYPGVRVLVVDDEPMNLLVAERLLKSCQLDVKTAGSGREAIEICREEAFDLIFLDHMMPEMDGVEALKILRKNLAHTEKKPVFIAFSANIVGGAGKMFLQEGFDEFIAKPIEERELKRLLKKLLSGVSVVYGKENSTEKSVVKGQRYLETKGFYVEEGLGYCNHDSIFYEEVLTRFAQDSENRILQIEAAFQKDDAKNYQILAHALKSSARMVGAEALFEIAREAEIAAGNQDLTYIHAHHRVLMDQYREAAQCIMDAFELAEVRAQEETSPVGTEVSGVELLPYLRKLRRCLDTYEPGKAEEVFTQMDGLVYPGTRMREFLRDIRQDVDDFEWETAIEKLETFLDGVEGGEV